MSTIHSRLTRLEGKAAESQGIAGMAEQMRRRRQWRETFVGPPDPDTLEMSRYRLSRLVPSGLAFIMRSRKVARLEREQATT